MMVEGVMNPFWGFINEAEKIFLEKVKGVCKIVQRCSSEEVYDGNLSGIFLLLCVEVSSYVGSYENIDVEDEHKVVFS